MAKIKTLKVCGKTSDLCFISFIDENDNEVGTRDGYVPNYFPEEHFGDYIQFDVDVETGQILNWKKPTQKQLKDSIQTK